MSIVGEYWTGVVDRLQAEVDVLNRLIGHDGEKGRENEQVLQRLLERLLPRRYGLGTGMMIDANGGYSKQIDLVVHDQQYHPVMLGQTTQLLHPVETVYAGVEVKTTLRSDDINDIRRVCHSVRKLAIPVETVTTLHSDNQLLHRQIRHPLLVAVAYDSDLKPATIERRFQEADPSERPDLLLVLKLGLVGSGGNFLYREDRGPTPGEFRASIAHLIVRNRSGQAFGTMTFSRRNSPPGSEWTHKGRRYPLVTIMTNREPVEPARALLVFLTVLTEALAGHPISQQSIMQRYLSNYPSFWSMMDVSPGPAQRGADPGSE